MERKKVTKINIFVSYKTFVLKICETIWTAIWSGIQIPEYYLRCQKNWIPNTKYYLVLRKSTLLVTPCCLHHHVQVFSRPLICPEVSWSVKGLSLVWPPPLPSSLATTLLWGWVTSIFLKYFPHFSQSQWIQNRFVSILVSFWSSD